MLLLSCLVATAASSGVSTLVLSTGKRSAVQPLLQLRGGLAGMDAGTAAKVAMGVYGANGVYFGLAPGPACERLTRACGVSGASYTLEQMAKAVGYMQVVAATFGLCLLNGVPLAAALGWSQVPWLLLTLDNLWNSVPAKMGTTAAGYYLTLAISGATAYCGFTDTRVPLAVIFSAGWLALNGVVLALAPGKCAEVWKRTNMVTWSTADEKVLLVMKKLGYAFAMDAVLMYAVVSGIVTTTAIGYSFVVLVVSLVDMAYISGERGLLRAMGAGLHSSVAVWGVIEAGIVAATLLCAKLFWRD